MGAVFDGAAVFVCAGVGVAGCLLVGSYAWVVRAAYEQRKLWRYPL